MPEVMLPMKTEDEDPAVKKPRRAGFNLSRSQDELRVTQANNRTARQVRVDLASTVTKSFADLSGAMFATSAE